jgi:hypothetical protein
MYGENRFRAILPVSLVGLILYTLTEHCYEGGIDA